MPKFSLDWSDGPTIQVARKQVFYLCRFHLPESYKEQTPLSETSKIEGHKMMGFYAEPVAGDRIFHAGHEWEVTRKLHWPTRRNSRDQKVVSHVQLKHISKMENTDEC